LTSAARKGANEALFRDVNERLERRALAPLPDEERFEILCECELEECTERIAVSFADYESVRARPTAFLVLPDHVDPTCERVAASAPGHAVVEKFGEAGAVAEAADPREAGEPAG
jgi:hypothetical protein